jgi:2'-5' RNA ligase
MRYHYYIGLQLPPGPRNHLALLQRELHDPIEAIEPLEPHITLLPPPAVEHINPQDLALHAKTAATAAWPLDIALTGITTFGGHAVALQVESEGIYELQRQLVRLLPFATNVRYYPHPDFVPHVTLVQAIRGKKLPGGLIEQYRQAAKALVPVSFTINHLTLFEWTGPRTYEARPI